MNRDMTKGARFGFYLFAFAMGSAFWIASMTGHFEMSADVYGRAVDVPSECWAGSMLFPSALYLVLLVINGRRRWTAPVRCLIGIWMMVYFTAFVVSALPAAGGDLMVIACGTLALKAALLTYFDGLDFLRKWHG